MFLCIIKKGTFPKDLYVEQKKINKAVIDNKN